MLETEFIRHFPSKICSKLISIRLLKTVAFCRQILRRSMAVKGHKSFSVSRKKAGKKAALKDTAANGLNSVVLCRRKVLCGRKGRFTDNGKVGQHVEGPIPGDLDTQVPDKVTARKKILHEYPTGVAVLEGKSNVAPIEASFVQIERSNDAANSIRFVPGQKRQRFLDSTREAKAIDTVADQHKEAADEVAPEPAQESHFAAGLFPKAAQLGIWFQTSNRFVKEIAVSEFIVKKEPVIID